MFSQHQLFTPGLYHEQPLVNIENNQRGIGTHHTAPRYSS